MWMILFLRFAAVTYSIPTPVLVMFANPYSSKGFGRPSLVAHFSLSPTLMKFRSSTPAVNDISLNRVGENVRAQFATPVSLRIGRNVPLAAKSRVVGELLFPDWAYVSRTPCVYRKNNWSLSERRWSMRVVAVHSSRLFAA